MHRRLKLTLLVCMLITLFWSADHLEAVNKTLYWGNTGSDVRLLQQRLKDWGYLQGTVDGNYGASTAEAVKKFQRQNGLTADGTAGPSTLKAMGIWTASAATTRTTTGAAVVSRGLTRRDDLALLARAVHAEAGAEPYEGKVAVGAVILNRIKSPEFPNTLAGVIYQPLAFESVANGIINRPPSAESLRAAQDALNGWDPVHGALFFWNPSKKVSKWIWSRKIIREIGGHVFAH